MSIWTWSMKLRFQIGSNRPLAKRNARMFCAASLPRKWSIRKICDSSNASCTKSLSRDRAGQVVAERLLHDHPGVSTRSASRSIVITAWAALGGTDR